MKLLILFAISCLAVSEGRRYNREKFNKGAVNVGFSLFSVVKFKNDYCVSQSPAGNGHNRHGLCFTGSECSTRGGQASGTCATGFGVCCLFYVTNGDVTQNITFIRNVGYPNSLTGSTFPTYTVKKCAADVCSLRLDFVNFDIGGPDGGNADGICQDTMTITSQTGVQYPVICGLNTGHHIYIDFGDGASSDIGIQFATTNNNLMTNRVWEIKARQIECTNMNRPPPGCLQYLTAASGRITTFNWDDGASSHLPNQDYTICIRRRPGVCCVQYLPCDLNSANTLDVDGSYNAMTMTGNSLIDSSCNTDYVRISGGQPTCSPGYSTVIDRICGSVFNAARGLAGARHQPICDCRAPFHVGIVTDSSVDADTSVLSRGLCLNYRQIGCS